MTGAAGGPTGPTVEDIAAEIDALAVAIDGPSEAGELALSRSVGDLAGGAGVVAGPTVVPVPAEIDALVVAVDETSLAAEFTLVVAVADEALGALIPTGSAVSTVGAKDNLTAVVRIPIAVGSAGEAAADAPTTTLTGATGHAAGPTVVLVAPGAHAHLGVHRDVAARLPRAAEHRPAVTDGIVELPAIGRGPTASHVDRARWSLELERAAGAQTSDAELTGTTDRTAAPAGGGIEGEIGAAEVGAAELVGGADGDRIVADTGTLPTGADLTLTARVAAGPTVGVVGLGGDTGGHTADLAAALRGLAADGTARALPVDAALTCVTDISTRTTAGLVGDDIDAGVVATSLGLAALLDATPACAEVRLARIKLGGVRRVFVGCRDIIARLNVAGRHIVRSRIPVGRWRLSPAPPTAAPCAKRKEEADQEQARRGGKEGR